MKATNRINANRVIVWVLIILGSVMQAYTQQNYRDLYSDTWVASDALGRLMPTFQTVGPVKTDQRRVVGIFYITWHTDDNAKMKSPYNGDVTRVLAADPNARLDGNNPQWTETSFHWGQPEMGYYLTKDEYVIRRDMSMLTDAGVDVLILDVTNAVRYWEEWDVLFSAMQKMKSEGNKVPQFCFWAFNGPSVTVVQDLYEKVYQTGKYRDFWFYWDGKPLLLYNSNPTVDAVGFNIKNPNPHYDPAAKTDPKHPHYGDPGYTEEFYTDYTREVKDFFTLRAMWWGYYEWLGKRFIGTEDNWSFGYNMADPKVKALKPEELISTHKGQREEAAVTPAQHPFNMTSVNMGVGKSWSRQYGEPRLNAYDLPDSAFVPWLGKWMKNPEGYGIYFQERWDDAIAANPQFLYINDWNEWKAGKFTTDNFPKSQLLAANPDWTSDQFPEGQYKTIPWLGRNNTFFFCDQYNAEFNRTVQPIKDGYTDNYYMQMAQNIRRYKGVRPIPELKGLHEVHIDGDFADWETMAGEYHDTRGDVDHRDFDGYGGLHYTDNSGRNDIITTKISVNNSTISFYAETDKVLTSHTGRNWMLLLIDSDNNPATGWYGYDYLVNKNIADEKKTTLMSYDPHHAGDPWAVIARLEYRYKGNKLELSIPRRLLGLTADAFCFDFKWCDNPLELKDPISLCTGGDAAPNRRFNYRCIWEK